jgi:flagellar motility protein MotE (MotC chaperone)
MASVNFQKFKSAGDAKAQFRHSDKEERKKAEHANKQIDKTKSDRNMQYKRNYQQTCERYDERIKELDNNGNTNKRKDRVTLLGLEIPAPEGLQAKQHLAWFKRVNEIIRDRYGSKNVLNSYIHLDEQHDYIDPETGQKRTSRVHGHCYVVPEKNGKLDAKTLTLRKNMISLNNEIEKMTVQEFGCRFMTGSKKKSGKSVEQLKAESRIAEANREADRIEKATAQQAAAMQLRESDLDERERELNRRETALRNAESEFKKKQAILVAEQEKAVTAQNKANETIKEYKEKKKKNDEVVAKLVKAVRQKVHAVQRSGRQMPEGLDDLQAKLNNYQNEEEYDQQPT